MVWIRWYNGCEYVRKEELETHGESLEKELADGNLNYPQKCSLAKVMSIKVSSRVKGDPRQFLPVVIMVES